MKKSTQMIVALTLALVLALGMTVPAFAKSNFNDTANHWAEDVIKKWGEFGVLDGYKGDFRPDDAITRAEAAAVISKTLGLNEKVANPFADLNSNAWYAQYILNCYAVGIISADAGKIAPDSTITGGEAVAMFKNAFGFAPAVDLTGNAKVSRAAFVSMIDSAVIQYIGKQGTYKMADGNGIILIAAQGHVGLEGKTSANIFVSPALRGKTVLFNKATVTGKITVYADDAYVVEYESDITEPTIYGKNTEHTDKITADIIGIYSF